MQSQGACRDSGPAQGRRRLARVFNTKWGSCRNCHAIAMCCQVLKRSCLTTRPAVPGSIKPACALGQQLVTVETQVALSPGTNSWLLFETRVVYLP